MLQPSYLYAKIFGGTKNIAVGETVSLEAEGSSSYYTVTGSWSVTGGSCYISARSNRSCKVTGIKSGTSTVEWIGAINGSFYEMYWTINVTGSGGGSGGSGGNSKTPDTGFSDNWTSSGNYSISWYNNSKSEYHISTSKELAGLAYLVNNGYTTFNGKVIKIDADIDLSGKNWVTIGDGQNYDFEGSFDGQNHTISGIYIVSQHEKQQSYGFWAGLFKATYIKNIRLQGKVSIESNKTLTSGYMEHSWPGHSFIGGFVGFANNVYFENCQCDMDVVCKRNHNNGYINLGGFAGQCRMNSSKDVAMKYCSHNGNLYASEWDSYSNPPRIGGLIGYSGITGGWDGVIEYCENNCSEIYCSQPYGNHSKSSNMYIGGLVGYGKPTIRYSRSIVETIKIDQSSSATMYFSIGGLGGDEVLLTNNYAIIKNLNVNSVTMNAGSGKVTFGGVASLKNSNSTANFSNSDININSSVSMSEGFHGAIFTSEQMKTNSFLEEINMYSQINMGNSIWTPDEYGYPCISQVHSGTSSITSIQRDDYLKDKVYNLFGRRLDKPSKGINIINGRKIIKK